MRARLEHILTSGTPLVSGKHLSQQQFFIDNPVSCGGKAFIAIRGVKEINSALKLVEVINVRVDIAIVVLF